MFQVSERVERLRRQLQEFMAAHGHALSTDRSG